MASPRGTIRVTVEHSGMKAVVRGLRPSNKGEEPVSREAILQALAAAGVVHGVDQAAIRELLGGLKDGRPAPAAAVAQGTPPAHGEDGRLELVRGAGAFVRPGEAVGTVRAATPGTEGRTVTGKAIPARAGRPAEVEVGAGVERVPEGADLRAQEMGVIAVEGNRVEVRPLFRVSGDAMRATLSLPAGGPDRAAPTASEVGEALLHAGVRHGADPNQLDALQRRAAAGEAIQDEAVAAGLPPVPGTDGRIDYRCRVGLLAGTTRADGSLDFHDRGFGGCLVEAGQVLAELVPASPGTPGRNVRGEEVPATEGQAVQLLAGPGVHTEAAGTTFRAEREGQALVERDRLSVYQVSAIDGDVDYSTGHLDVGTRAIQVRGHVRSTFRVQADGPVVVEGSIGDALVVSRTSVHVGCGITQRGKGLVASGGEVETLHAQNARILALDDVTVHAGLVHGQVWTAGRLLAPGDKGRVLGGEVHAAGGIEVEEAGSRGGTRTLLAVGPSPDLRKALKGAGKVVGELAEKLHAARPAAAPTVRVRGTVHPGVEVALGTARLKVTETVSAAEFHLGAGGTVAMRALEG